MESEFLISQAHPHLVMPRLSPYLAKSVLTVQLGGLMFEIHNAATSASCGKYAERLYLCMYTRYICWGMCRVLFTEQRLFKSVLAQIRLETKSTMIFAWLGFNLIW